jgi:hypothetical protein
MTECPKTLLDCRAGLGSDFDRFAYLDPARQLLTAIPGVSPRRLTLKGYP